jgi:hypothetical protein
MLRISDDAGFFVQVTSGQPGLLRVRAQVPPLGPTAARVLLAADLLMRAAEFGQSQVLVNWAFGDPSDEQAAVAAASALNIHPPAADTGQPDVVVVAGGATPSGDRDAITLRVAEAHGRPDILTGEDQLAVRLALMSYPYAEPADLSDDVLATARDTLGRWRHEVATWAESPSSPVPTSVTVGLRSAFDELDTGAVLALLRGAARDDRVPAGARFETFLLADRLLGLDLPRDIGRS